MKDRDVVTARERSTDDRRADEIGAAEDQDLTRHRVAACSPAAGLLRPAQEQRRDHTEERQDRDEREGSIERRAQRIRGVGAAELRHHGRNRRSGARLTTVLDELRVLALQGAAELRGGQLMTGRRRGTQHGRRRRARCLSDRRRELRREHRHQHRDADRRADALQAVGDARRTRAEVDAARAPSPPPSTASSRSPLRNRAAAARSRRASSMTSDESARAGIRRRRASPCRLRPPGAGRCGR